MAAAAMAAASNVASQFLARPSVNQTEAALSNGNSSTSSANNSSNSNSSSSDVAQKGLATGDGEIPWRQIAGLLHGQGITDPLGLVSHLPSSQGVFA